MIPQGVDGKKYHPQSRKGTLKHPSVSIIQNHAIRPKFNGLLQFTSVIKEMRDWHFYISKGQLALEPQAPLLSLQAALEDCENVTFLDIQTPEAVNELFTETDVYVLATGLDWCPTTVLEAGLMTRPTVASKISGVVEVIDEGVNGFTARNGDVDDWVTKIRKAVDLDGEAARRYVMGTYDWSVINLQVERVLREEAVTFPRRFFDNMNPEVKRLQNTRCPNCSQPLRIRIVESPMPQGAVLHSQRCEACNQVLFQSVKRGELGNGNLPELRAHPS